jgi:hypothetical protein
MEMKYLWSYFEGFFNLTTWDEDFTMLPKEGVLRIFIAFGRVLAREHF